MNSREPSEKVRPLELRPGMCLAKVRKNLRNLEEIGNYLAELGAYDDLQDIHLQVVDVTEKYKQRLEERFR